MTVVGSFSVVRPRRMLLTPHQAKAARSVLDDLSRALLRLRCAADGDPSLAAGDAGIALGHAALATVFPRRAHRAAAEHALSRAVNALATQPLGPALYRGFTGVAWAAELVSNRSRGPAREDPAAPIDQALLTYLKTGWPSSRVYDLMQGLVGIGVYALERVHRAAGRRVLSLVVERLAETARPRRPGISWWSDPEWVPETSRETPHPAWNLGVAHGVPGVIAFLGRTVAADTDATTRHTAARLLERSVTWLLAQELPEDASGAFPRAVGQRFPHHPARLAWCYGDIGVASTLLVAARMTGRASWANEARRIGLRAASRRFEQSGVMDAGLCHGAAGVAHMFHRLFLGTREKVFLHAARDWFKRTLAMRGLRRGFGGFATFDPDVRGSWRAEPGFLRGPTGIALALVAATTDAPPTWDRALLLS